ncbi:2-phospho-L-lactate guanylyltransferase [Afipia massiliensis]|nr:2-phospho-L-lactate guanylyltransferase [Afipia massiliensis]
METFADNPSNIWAIVPVKRLSHAKQRLAPVLSRNERVKLARTMLHEVLTTLCASDLAGIMVVTSDPMVAKLATLFDARVIHDGMEAGVNAAVQQGLGALDATAGALIIPADVPFATASDLRAIIDELQHHPVVLAPALSDGGTNALAMRAPDMIVPKFGEDSYLRHQMQSRVKGLPCGVVSSDGIGRDIDRPQDLVAPMVTRKYSLTAALLVELNISIRLGVGALPLCVRHM